MKLIITAMLAVILAGPTFLLNETSAEDALTPEEIACAPLDNPGVTKGLLGLCLAYCASEGIVDDDEFSDNEYSKDRKKLAKILRKYNKKKADHEPEMPCLETPCPCWTEGEMSNFGPIDRDSNSYPVSCTDGGQRGSHLIGYGPTPTQDPFGDDGSTVLRLSGAVAGPFTVSENETQWLCSIQDVDHGIAFFRVDDITFEEYKDCANQMIDRCSMFAQQFSYVE